MNRAIAQSADVEELGPGVQFQVQKDGRLWWAFIIRFRDEARCYLNACAHVGLRLNADKDLFFDAANNLLCRAHGASYDAADGKCKDGPCQGYGLIPLAIREENGNIFYEDETYQLAKQS